VLELEFRRCLVRLHHGASLRWSIGGVLRLHTRPKGYRAAAPPLRRLCLMDFSVQRSKWCVSSSAVADHRSIVLKKEEGGLGRFSHLVLARVLFASLQAPL
jgi:hypothetical protein